MIVIALVGGGSCAFAASAHDAARIAARAVPGTCKFWKQEQAFMVSSPGKLPSTGESNRCCFQAPLGVLRNGCALPLVCRRNAPYSYHNCCIWCTRCIQ